jgi:hypothetical protein
MSSNNPANRLGISHTGRVDAAVPAPCYNEEHAIAKVVAEFPAALPAAAIHVYDKNSADGTAAAARLPAFLSFAGGFILDTVRRGRRESCLALRGGRGTAAELNCA